MPDGQAEEGYAAQFSGLKIPHSPFLTPGRIARIQAGKYEKHEIAGALEVVGPEDVVLEIGAGLGIVGGVIAKICNPRHVYAFEANPNLIPTISHLHRLNGLSQAITVENAVLLAGSDVPADVPFHLHKSYLGSSLSDPGARRKDTVQVPVRGFAHVCAQISPTVLVMDIEGGELDLLTQANLSIFRAVVVEFHPSVYDVTGMRACKAALRAAGFSKLNAVSSRTVWTCVREAQA